jgi:hypothetical protein
MLNLRLFSSSCSALGGDENDKKIEALENRVAVLEQQGLKNTSPEMKALRSQLQRLDPAQKCLIFEDFVDTELEVRTFKLEEFLAQIPNCPPKINIEHITKGLKNARVPTSVTLVDFFNNGHHDQVLEALRIKVLEGGQLKCRRAKTTIQRDRSNYLKKAFDTIKVVHEYDVDAKFNRMSRRIIVKVMTTYSQVNHFGSSFFAQASIGAQFLPPTRARCPLGWPRAFEFRC